MKKHLLIFLTFLLSLNLCGQTNTDSICTDFDDSALFITNLSSSWQIGPPSKLVFNNSYSPINSIITDTVNTYPSNDTSIFYAIYAPDYIVDNLDFYYPFSVEFYHRYDTDSLTDFGSIELSKDGGNTWINGLSGEYNGNFFSMMDNSHIFLSTGDTIYDSLAITGSSNGWVHSTITIDANGWIWSTGLIPDSIIVKFTFKSDSINNFKDGWQIDNLCLKYQIGSISINEYQLKNNFKIYPNPFSSQTTLRTDKVLKDAILTLYNALGQQAKQVNNINGQTLTLNRDNLPSGLYYLQLTQDNQTIATDKLVITD